MQGKVVDFLCPGQSNMMSVPEVNLNRRGIIVLHSMSVIIA